MRLQIPSKLKIQKLINKYPVHRIKGFHKDKVYFICNSIFNQMNRLDKETFRYENKYHEYYVPLSSEILKNALGDSYAEILAWMKKSEIIICDDQFLIGIKCRCYRFHNRYLCCNRRWISIAHEPLKKKYKKLGAKSFQYYSRIVGKLKSLFENGKLTINYTGASEAIEQLVKNKYGEEWRKYSGKSDKFIKGKLLNMQLSLPCDMIRKGEHRVIQDKIGFRLHTTITALKRELRSFVGYDGRRLGEIDMKNSQFYFLIYLLNSDNWKYIHSKHEHNNRKRLLFTHLNEYLSIESNNNYSNIITLLKKLEIQYGKGMQGHSFLQHVCEGDLYERLITYLDSTDYDFKGYNDNSKRTLVKKHLISLLFADPIKDAYYYSRTNEGKIWQAFIVLYPEIAAIVAVIKRVNYKLLSWLLQRIESYCIINEVCGTLLNDHPNIPIFTLHDSLITTTENVFLVQEYMQEGIGRVIGFKPSIKTDLWQSKDEGGIIRKAA